MSIMVANAANPGLPNQDQAQGQDGYGDDDALIAPQHKFSPEEEAASFHPPLALPLSHILTYASQTLAAESNTHKAEANSLFTSGKYDAAINKYDEALAVCPNYLDYELAVLRSNIAACHLKLEEWKEAVENASKALEGLDKVEREEKERNAEADKTAKQIDDDDVVEVEIVSAGAAKAGPSVSAPENENEVVRRKRQEDIARIRSKALMRRGRAKSELATWRDLEDSLKDYERLSSMANLSLADKKIVRSQLKALPPRIETAKQAETAEMWGKLKDLGNGILRPFGLSTDQFNMVKDEKTGGYSLNFQGGGGGGSSGGTA